MSTESEAHKQHLTELCDRAASSLAEHADSVHIFITKQLDDGSTDTPAVKPKEKTTFTDLCVDRLVVIQPCVCGHPRESHHQTDGACSADPQNCRCAHFRAVTT